MHAAFQAIILCWIAFLLIWIAKSLGTKRTAAGTSLAEKRAYGLPTLIGFILVFWGEADFLPAPLRRWLWPHSAVAQWAAFAVVLAGLVVAVSARFAIGRNWSAQVVLKEEHELVTTGIYAWVRHPIYTGMLTMVAGTAVAVGTATALAGFLVLTIGTIIKLRQEETIMLRQFPDSYPGYSRRVKRLIPSIW